MKAVRQFSSDPWLWTHGAVYKNTEVCLFFPLPDPQPDMQKMLILCLKLHQIWLSWGVCLLPTTDELKCRSGGTWRILKTLLLSSLWFLGFCKRELEMSPKNSIIIIIIIKTVIKTTVLIKIYYYQKASRGCEEIRK